jgi:hypothetical protein
LGLENMFLPFHEAGWFKLSLLWFTIIPKSQISQLEPPPIFPINTHVSIKSTYVFGLEALSMMVKQTSFSNSYYVSSGTSKNPMQFP